MSTKTYRNRLRKSVQVKSNDPERPSVHLFVEAFVKPEVGFESSSLSVDNIVASQTTVKEAFINLAGYTGIAIDSIVTSTPLITAKVGEDSDTMANDQRLRIEVALGPGFDPGLLSESVTVHYAGDHAASRLYLYGIVVDDIQVTPLALTYVIPGSGSDTAWSKSRTLTVTKNRDDLNLEIVGVSDPAGLLDFTVTEVEPARTYRIEAVLKPIDLSADMDIASTVVITTNHDPQKTIEIPVRIEQK